MTGKNKKHTETLKSKDQNEREKNSDEQSGKKKGDRKPQKKNGNQNEKATLNGVSNQNVKNKNKNPKRANSNHEKSKSSGWSTLAYVNVFLLMILLILTGSFLFLCSNGDFSVEGVKSSWPCIQHNVNRLQNISAEVINKENLQEIGQIVWLATLKAFEKFLAASKIVFAITSQFLERSVEILGPYAERLTPYVFKVKDSLHHAFEWITNPENWNVIYNYLAWIATSLYEQVLVLKGEMDKNNISFTYAFDNIKTWPSCIWNSTSSIRTAVWTVYNNASSQWLPYYADQASNLVDSMRLSVEHLFH